MKKQSKQKVQTYFDNLIMPFYKPDLYEKNTLNKENEDQKNILCTKHGELI